jgi:uncharacterized protein (TIGR02391 family)
VQYASGGRGGRVLRADATGVHVDETLYQDLAAQGLIDWEVKDIAGNISLQGMEWLERGGPAVEGASVTALVPAITGLTIRDDQLREQVEDLLAAGRAFNRVILNACVVLEDRVRQASGLGSSLIGTALMQEAFKPQGGPLCLSTDDNEQRGAMEMYRGTIAFFRNATGHRVPAHFTQDDAVRFVAWIDLLLAMLGGPTTHSLSGTTSTP